MEQRSHKRHLTDDTILPAFLLDRSTQDTSVRLKKLKIQDQEGRTQTQPVKTHHLQSSTAQAQEPAIECYPDYIQEEEDNDTDASQTKTSPLDIDDIYNNDQQQTIESDSDSEDRNDQQTTPQYTIHLPKSSIQRIPQTILHNKPPLYTSSIPLIEEIDPVTSKNKALILYNPPLNVVLGDAMDRTNSIQSAEMIDSDVDAIFDRDGRNAETSLDHPIDEASLMEE